MNNRKKLNCGVIGVGRLGYQHAMNLARNNRANLVAVADPNEDARDLAVQDFGVEKTYDDYHKILEDPDIQGVVIATPTKQHYKVLVDAINADKSIFVEKPISIEQLNLNPGVAKLCTADILDFRKSRST